MNNKILLPQFTTLLASATRMPKKQVDAFIKAFFATISETVVDHENVKIKGFGTFKVNKVEARKSVNVSTGREVEIPAHYKLVFAPSKDFAERVNKDFSWLEIVEITDNLSTEELSSLDEDPVSAPETGKKKVAAGSTPATPKAEVKEQPHPGLPKPTPMAIVEDEPVVDSPVAVPQNEPIPLTEEVKVETAEEVRIEKTVDDDTIINEPVKQKEVVAEVRETVKPAAVAPSVVIKPAEEPHDPTLEHPPVEKEVPKAITEKEEDRSEELGEKLEEDFGQIEPVEPFGPIDPDDPEPGEPVPENKYITREEFDEFVSKKEQEFFSSKEELALAKKSLRKLKRDVGEATDKSKSSVRKAVIISFLIAAILVCGGAFLVYYLLLNKIQNVEVEEVEMVEENDDSPESTDAIVADFNRENDTALASKQLAQANEDTVKKEAAPQPEKTAETKTQQSNATPAANNTAANNAAPTKASDVKYDTVTTTRYLTSISKEHYGNYHFWPYIYLENENILGHPDRIKPGTKVKVPSLSKYGVDPKKPADVAKAKKLGQEIYKRFN